MGLRLLAPWGEPLQFWLSSCLWVAHLRVWVFVSAPAACLVVVPSLCLVVEHLFCQSLGCLHSCSVNMCNIFVPMEGDEFRVFLFCHLGHTPIFVPFKKQKNKQTILIGNFIKNGLQIMVTWKFIHFVLVSKCYPISLYNMLLLSKFWLTILLFSLVIVKYKCIKLLLLNFLGEK